jgi:two-component system nitrate/nitrite response regulator NarL
VKILVVDDHKLLLHGFAAALRALRYVERVDVCSNYEELKKQLKIQTPDLIFLDLNLPPYSGLSICQEIRQVYKDVFVAILTSYDDNFLVQEARKNGADAYFLKSVDIEVIEKFLADYHHGLINDFVIHIPSRPEKPGPSFDRDPFALVSALSKREVEVLKRIVKGMDHDEIMVELNICYDTFKSHRTHAMQKLKLKNVAELVQFALKNNLVDGILEN